MHKKFKKIQIDALFEAICEEGYSPYFVVVAEHPSAVVPMDFVKNGVITLDLSAGAVKHFDCDDDGFMYSANFGNKHHTVVIPYEAIAAVYPKGEPAAGFQFPVTIPEEPVEPRAPLKVADEATFGERNPNAHVGWEKSATVV